MDDEPDIQKVASLALEATGGFHVTLCSSGAEALSEIGRCAPDLILLDVMMPDMDGRGAMHCLNEFRGRVANVRQRGDDGGFSVTVSCGIATFPQYGNVGALIGAAERALKRAKGLGRNRVMLAGA